MSIALSEYHFDCEGGHIRKSGQGVQPAFIRDAFFHPRRREFV